jgi:hypothetical protein
MIAAIGSKSEAVIQYVYCSVRADPAKHILESRRTEHENIGNRFVWPFSTAQPLYDVPVERFLPQRKNQKTAADDESISQHHNSKSKAVTTMASTTTPDTPTATERW